MIIQIIAALVIVATIYLLIKKYETRMVLIAAGLVLCIISLVPMDALNAFSERMVSAPLIQAICSSMGFAYVMKYTKCDKHLVLVLSRVLTRLGFFLIPAAVVLTFFINIAIPSAAGCAAAVGATLIPLLIAARIHPAIAGGAVLCGTIGSMLSPGLSHNPFVAQMSNMSIVDLIARHGPYSLAVGGIAAVSLAIVALVKKECNMKAVVEVNGTAGTEQNAAAEQPNYLYATAPFIPLILLILPFMDALKAYQISVPAAMVIGAIYALVITRTNPSTITKEFFKGMGNAYGDVLGIIIAAAVFSAGLKASGLIDSFIGFLIHSPEFARWGGTLGPFLMGIITGSGDAAAFAFNETVTPFAQQFGYEIPDLGMASAISGALGRTMSPLAGAAIVCAGLANVNPMEIVKRTAPGMIVGVIFIALIML
ncbi:C4-dicarboxylate ABC transporter [Providencia sp. wls1922]|uniref:C4-dicarboxylate transporter DcuC n=1 Tax=Providencia sp. wls1922 TaxID=2675152 RepID=UPI0012B560B4|nr:C4-dicarboxylate transporter DcuC [Providencia sp. wls1922]MTC47239.1 C4-dicarboxylate ABC transporter [Providencia sp. wls1922]